MEINAEFIEGYDHYKKLICDGLYQAKESIWIATANVKDLHLETHRGEYNSIFHTFAYLNSLNVDIRILHSGIPSENFLSSFSEYRSLLNPNLFTMRRCPRVHLKTIIFDSCSIYLGSANLTGAGLGAKSEKNRNFEIGLLSDDDKIITNIGSLYEQIWDGNNCKNCGRKRDCPAPLEELTPETKI